MRTLFIRTVTALVFVSLLALCGCTAGTSGNGSTPGSSSGSTADPDSGNAPAQADIPAEGEPLAGGTPVMYEFYSDT